MLLSLVILLAAAAGSVPRAEEGPAEVDDLAEELPSPERPEARRPDASGALPATRLDELWAAVRAHAPVLRAARRAREAGAVARARAGRAWIPRVSFSGSAFGTDDPGGNFFALLGQREVEAPDFAPDALNDPGARLFARAALRAEWTAFDAGVRAAERDAAGRTEQARAFEEKSAEAALFVETLRLFAAAAVFEDTRAAASALDHEVARILEEYRIGTPDNPLGFAGRLGLQALRLRLQALVAAQEAGAAAAGRALATLAGLGAPVPPIPVEVAQLVEARLGVAEESPSARVRALEAVAEGLAAREALERARLWPRAAVFAEAPATAGGRGLGLAWTAGATVGWDLLAAQDWGAADEARLAAEAARERFRAEAERERIGAIRAREQRDALARTLPLLEKNLALLGRQTALARQLFANGVIQALQLSDALGRRADAVEALGQARLAYLDAAGAYALAAGLPAPGGADAR